MNKRGLKWIWILILVILLILIVLGLIVYFSYFKSLNLGDIKPISNPADGLTDEQAVQQFNESFVYYVLYNIGANSISNPKIEFKIDDEVYNAVKENGALKVTNGQIQDGDVRIRTTKSEAIKMMRNREYITTSFQNGLSGMDMVASKTTLFTKGYLKIYSALTGKSITGNAIRIFS